MKGISFQNGVEYKITILGEQWQQGDTLSGELKITSKNSQSGAPKTGALKARVLLVETTERKLKSKSNDAFEIIHEAKVDGDGTSWTFSLPLNSRISDKAGCICVLYGAQEDLHALGILKLNIVPHHYFRDLIELMRTEFRYALKSLSAGKNGWVLANLENLTLALKQTQETIDAKFEFARTRVDAMKAGLQTKIEKQEIARSWKTKEFVHDFNDRINKDVATDSIQNVISEYQSGSGWLA